MGFVMKVIVIFLCTLAPNANFATEPKITIEEITRYGSLIENDVRLTLSVNLKISTTVFLSKNVKRSTRHKIHVNNVRGNDIYTLHLEIDAPIENGVFQLDPGDHTVHLHFTLPGLGKKLGRVVLKNTALKETTYHFQLTELRFRTTKNGSDDKRLVFQGKSGLTKELVVIEAISV